jgi:hypothetical protein
MLGHGELAEWTRAWGSQIWTGRCYGCGCWALIFLNGPRMRGAVVTQLLPDASEEGAPVKIECL